LAKQLRYLPRVKRTGSLVRDSLAHFGDQADLARDPCSLSLIGESGFLLPWKASQEAVRSDRPIRSWDIIPLRTRRSRYSRLSPNAAAIQATNPEHAVLGA